MKNLILLICTCISLICYPQNDTISVIHPKLMYLEIYEGNKLLHVVQFKGKKHIPIKDVKSWRLIYREKRNYSRLYFNFKREDNNEQWEMYYENLEEQQLIENDYP